MTAGDKFCSDMEAIANVILDNAFRPPGEPDMTTPPATTQREAKFSALESRLTGILAMMAELELQTYNVKHVLVGSEGDLKEAKTPSPQSAYQSELSNNFIDRFNEALNILNDNILSAQTNLNELQRELP